MANSILDLLGLKDETIVVDINTSTQSLVQEYLEKIENETKYKEAILKLLDDKEFYARLKRKLLMDGFVCNTRGLYGINMRSQYSIRTKKE